jgi:hypothetical protein
MVGEKMTDTCHYTLPCPMTFDKNDEVIGITGKTMSSFLQLLIQIIQEDVGQKR